MKRITTVLSLFAVTIFIAACGGGSSSHSTRVSETRVQTTGKIRCSIHGGQSMGSCPLVMQRRGSGTASVTITKPDGQIRSIFFTNGVASGYDSFDGGPRFNASKQGDLSIIRIGPEWYEIPDAVLSGN